MERRKPRRLTTLWILLASAVLLGAIALGLQAWRSAVPDDSDDALGDAPSGHEELASVSPVAPPTPEAAQEVAAEALTAGTRRPVPLPLPPLDAPVAEYIEHLDARAEAGDVRSACRVAQEAHSCSYFLSPSNSRRTEQQMIDWLAQSELEGEELEQRIRMQGQWSDRWQAEMKRCSGFPEHLLASPQLLDLRAARLGDSLAAMRFLTLNGVSVPNLLSQPELVAAYRREALSLLIAQLQSGNPLVVEMWEHATRPDSQSPLSAVLTDDWRNPDVAQALRPLVGQPMGEHDPARDQPIPPEAVERAQALYDRWFDTPEARRFRERLKSSVEPRTTCDSL